VQVEQSGCARVPPRIGATSPHPVQRTQRCLQARHHGVPVVWEITQGASLPQMLQVPMVSGRQLGQSGPAGVRVLTGRRRPQEMQVSWLAGSVIKQCGHRG